MPTIAVDCPWPPARHQPCIVSAAVELAGSIVATVNAKAASAAIEKTVKINRIMVVLRGPSRKIGEHGRANQSVNTGANQSPSYRIDERAEVRSSFDTIGFVILPLVHAATLTTSL